MVLPSKAGLPARCTRRRRNSSLSRMSAAQRASRIEVGSFTCCCGPRQKYIVQGRTAHAARSCNNAPRRDCGQRCAMGRGPRTGQRCEWARAVDVRRTGTRTDASRIKSALTNCGPRSASHADVVLVGSLSATRCLRHGTWRGASEPRDRRHRGGCGQNPLSAAARCVSRGSQAYTPLAIAEKCAVFA